MRYVPKAHVMAHFGIHCEKACSAIETRQITKIMNLANLVIKLFRTGIHVTNALIRKNWFVNDIQPKRGLF